MTQSATCSPAGMHGQSLAWQRGGSCAPLLPAAVFLVSGYGSMLQNSLAYHLLEANTSKRPFTRPQRLSSFENYRGEVKRSRPTSSVKF